MSSGELLIKLKGDAKGFLTATDQVKGGLAGIETDAKHASSAIKDGMVAAAAAVAAVWGAKKFFEPFMAQEQAIASLKAALISTGNYGSTALGSIADEANRLQSVTTASNDALIKASATLQTLAPSLNPTQLKSAEQAIVSIADTFAHGDVNNAATLIGKTLGSTTNALTRFGIHVDMTKNSAQKLGEILSSTVVKGGFQVSKAAAETLAGRLTQLKNAFQDLLKPFGQIVVDAAGLESHGHTITQQLETLSDYVNKNRKAFTTWATVGVAAIKAVAESLMMVVRVAFDFGESIGSGLLAVWDAMHGNFKAFHEDNQRAKSQLLDIEGALNSNKDAWTGLLQAVFNAQHGITSAADANKKGSDAADKAASAAIRQAMAAQKVAAAYERQKKAVDALGGVSNRSMWSKSQVGAIGEYRKRAAAAWDVQHGVGYVHPVGQVQPLLTSTIDYGQQVNGGGGITGMFGGLFGNLRGRASSLFNPQMIMSTAIGGLLTGGIGALLQGGFGGMIHQLINQPSIKQLNASFIANIEALNANTDAIKAGQQSVGLPTNSFVKAMQQAFQTPGLYSAALTSTGGGRQIQYQMYVSFLTKDLANLGLSFQQLQSLAKSYGIDLTKGLGAFKDFITKLQNSGAMIKQYYQSFSGGMAMLQEQWKDLGATPLQQFQQTIAFVSNQVGGTLGKTLAGLTPQTFRAFAQNAMQEIASGNQSFLNSLNGVSAQQFLQFLDSASGQIQALGVAASGASNQILNMPSGFKVALDRFKSSVGLSGGGITVPTTGTGGSTLGFGGGSTLLPPTTGTGFAGTSVSVSGDLQLTVQGVTDVDSLVKSIESNVQYMSRTGSGSRLQLSTTRLS